MSPRTENQGEEKQPRPLGASSLRGRLTLLVGSAGSMQGSFVICGHTTSVHQGAGSPYSGARDEVAEALGEWRGERGLEREDSPQLGCLPKCPR